GSAVLSSGAMMEALRLSSELGFLISDHPEDPEISAGGIVNEGVAEKLGVKGIPRIAEEIVVARDLMLAEATGGRLHIAHVSTARSVELIAEFKGRGVSVTAEVTPHHLTLTEEAVLSLGSNGKMKPPLRGGEDVEALIEGLKEGIIDVIATDHAPHAPWEKERGLEEAPFGVVGFETCFPVLYTELVLEGRLALRELIAKLTLEPAKVLGLDRKGRLAPGMDADLVIIDLEREVVIDPEKLRSKGKNTPFAGRRVKGIPVGLIIGGEVRFYEGDACA
ncbi:dihydroorotase, partial [Candidatus Poribacteria bacterium]